MIRILLFLLILHLDYLGLLKLKEILDYYMTSVGICKSIKDLILGRILNILSLDLLEIFLMALVLFKLSFLKKNFRPYKRGNSSPSGPGEIKHYYVEMGSKTSKTAIIAHFNKYPLLGHKRVTYSR